MELLAEKISLFNIHNIATTNKILNILIDKELELFINSNLLSTITNYV